MISDLTLTNSNTKAVPDPSLSFFLHYVSFSSYKHKMLHVALADNFTLTSSLIHYTVILHVTAITMMGMGRMAENHLEPQIANFGTPITYLDGVWYLWTNGVTIGPERK